MIFRPQIREKTRYQALCNSLILLIFLSATTLLSGCFEGGPREAPYPIFNARAPFSELGEARKKTPKSADKPTADGDEFERAIAQAMASDEPPEEATPEESRGENTASDAASAEAITLPGGLRASLPGSADEWRWSSDNQSATITHQSADQAQPDALIYLQGFSPIIDAYPSREVQQFLTLIDPSFTPFFELADTLETSLEPGMKGSPGDEEGAASEQIISGALNYRSTPKSFSGWKWVGLNEHHIDIKLGRTHGRWASPGDSSAQAGRSRSAWMLVGSARAKTGLGAHLAIICEASPRCPVAEELADFLATLGAP